MVKMSSILIRVLSGLMTSVVLAIWAPITTAGPASVPATLSHCGDALITNVQDGATLTAADGTRISLSAIKAPELWPQDAAYSSWPHAQWARDTLDRLTLGKTVQLYCEGETKSVNNEKIVHIQLPGGEWLQHILVERGTAFVFPRGDHISGIEALYAAEDEARQNSLGIWQTNRILSVKNGTDNKDIRTGWFQVIRGTVLNAARVRRQTFLNFGENWRKDFTVEIPASARQAFKKAGVDPMSFQSQFVEVRGWVTWKGGPHIMVEGPGQIRIIEQ